MCTDFIWYKKILIKQIIYLNIYLIIYLNKNQFFFNFICKIIIDNADHGILSGPPKFDPGHLNLSVTGPDGPPTFKT